MDTLTIKGMRFRGLHGVHDYEKKEGNDFEVDVIFNTDLTAPGASDQLKDAIDYTRVHEIASSVLFGDSKNLIEHLCLRIGNHIQDAFQNQSNFEVVVRKLNPPLDSEVNYTEARMSWPR
ncbi:MAG: dihydroneopterin aldolase [Gracilimonas sp.]|jgi:dihydroneopterin aldolase|nr:dihydroneopterin aldolase [Gracilimonas sp.]